MIKEAIVKIVSKQDLTYDEAYSVMNEVIAEISGCAAAMREHALKVDTKGMKVLEIVGTGGRSRSARSTTPTLKQRYRSRSAPKGTAAIILA